jgi:cell division protein FtsZ
MNIKLELPQLTDLKPRLTVIGIGGAGCNAVNNMIAAGLTGVEFVVANTDAQTLEASSAEHRIQLGMNLTEGLGAGANPEIGAAAAEEAVDEIKSQISGSHMVFLAAGMGGGTGTGAISVIARTSRELGILTVGVVTKPFQFEGSRRMRMAEAGIDELRQYVDTLIVIPNQNLFRVANEKTTFAEAFLLADQVLYSGVACIVDLIVREGLINLDFADVRAVMRDMGTAMMGTGESSGERRAITAAEEAIANPLLDDVSLQGAKGLLLSITGGPDMTLYEVDEAASRIRKEVDSEANIIVGATFDHTLDDRIRVSIVASGMASSALAIGTPSRAAGLPGFNLPGGHSRAAPGGARNLPPNVPQPPPIPATASSTNKPPRSVRPNEAPRSEPVVPGTKAVPANNSTLWRSPEGVTIESGSAALGARGTKSAPAPQVPTKPGSGSSQADFEPRQTEEIHRQSHRMPEVSDFPAVGQREYYAKRQGGDPNGSGNREGRRRQGLFQRLTGLGRRGGDSPEIQDTDKQHPVTGHEITGGKYDDVGRKAYPHDVGRESNKDRQGVELPDFFEDKRKRN